MKHCCPKEWFKFFKAVCDENRQKILEYLHDTDKANAGDIVKKLKLSQPTVSHHLKILTDAEVLTAKKKGKEVYYSLNSKIITNCCGGFMKRYSHKKK